MSLEGQINAVHGGRSLNLAGLDRVLSVSGADLDRRVAAGVTREQLNADLRGQGLFFPLDPVANATLGGSRKASPRRCARPPRSKVR